MSCLHIRADELLCENVEILVGTDILQMLCNTDFRTDDKILLVGLYRIIHYARC